MLGRPDSPVSLADPSLLDLTSPTKHATSGHLLLHAQKWRYDQQHMLQHNTLHNGIMYVSEELAGDEVEMSVQSAFCKGLINEIVSLRHSTGGSAPFGECQIAGKQGSTHQHACLNHPYLPLPVYAC